MKNLLNYPMSFIYFATIISQRHLGTANVIAYWSWNVGSMHFCPTVQGIAMRWYFGWCLWSSIIIMQPNVHSALLVH